MRTKSSTAVVAGNDLYIQSRLDKKEQRKRYTGMVLPFVGLIFIFVFFLIVTDGKLLNDANRTNLVNQCFTITLVSIGASFVYAYGGSDFSIGATCGCSQLVAAVLLTKLGMPLWVCLAACVLVAVLASFLTASTYLVFGVPVFIGSMCVRTAFAGILSTATQGSEYFISISQYGFMNNTAVKVAILVLFFTVGYYFFQYTSVGKSLRAIGGNIKTANQAGVPVKLYIVIAHVILGVCVGVAAIFQMFRSGTVNSLSGNGVEFNMMMAIILGGFPMRGGERSRISAAVVGALTVTILTNGLALWGVDAYTVNLLKGLMFVAVVSLSYDRSMGKLVN